MLLIDAHVHIYDCFDLRTFFDSAYSNFKSAAERLGHEDDFTGILLLTETAKDNWFQHLVMSDEAPNPSDSFPAGGWEIYHTNENLSIVIRLRNDKHLLLIAGRQIATAEGLEVLALMTAECFEDYLPLMEVIENVCEIGGIPVIPWGFGKWIGGRGAIIGNILRSADDLGFYLGDNSNRPGFFLEPRQFKMARRIGIGILPGSDPFPFANEQERAGSFGMILDYKLSDNTPAHSLKMALKDRRTAFKSYGVLERPYRFFRNQLLIQIHKRFSS